MSSSNSYGLIVPEGKSIAILPDLFISFLALEPRINPYHEEVRDEAHAWICNYMNADDAKRKQVQDQAFSWFCVIGTPDASRERLRAFLDWGNWIVLFDDLFDNGQYRDDPEKTNEILDSMLSIMDNPSTPPSRFSSEAINLLNIYDDICSRVKAGSTSEVASRYKTCMTMYADSVKKQMVKSTSALEATIDEYLRIRRGGIVGCFVLMQYCYKIDLPDEIYNNEAIKEFTKMASTTTLLGNDIYSYAKEEDEAVPHNIIVLYKRKGHTTQEAFKLAGDLYLEYFQRLLCSQALIPIFSEKIDAQIWKYVEGIKSTMCAALWWHFKSDRYFFGNEEIARYKRAILVKKF